ncbi:MAG TPA: type 1 glutamine amidotransferase [Candidatus Xenobia bacterium]|jgi:GMP synthase-like glutamine amidotransferase
MLYVIRQWKNGNVVGITWHIETRRIPFQFIEAYDTPEYPKLQQGDAVIALGGPPSVCRLREPDFEYDFLLPEADFLAELSRENIPFMGICLGHQLRAKMEDNPVEQRHLVFGVQDVDLTEAGRRHWLFDGIPDRFQIYQHHRDHVVSVNHGAVVLGNSETCPVEAVAWNDSSVSVQFHPEVLDIQFEDAILKYPKQLEATGLTFDEMLERVPGDYMWYINRLFDNFFGRAGLTSIRLSA